MSAVVPAPKQNNFLQTTTMIQQMKFLIILETLLGINRLYLCGYRKCVLWLSYIYDVILLISIVFFVIHGNLYTTTQHFYKDVTSIEYLFLGFSALLIQNRKLRKFFSSLQIFDEKLNIGDEVSLLYPRRWYLYAIGVVLLYSILENIFCEVFVFYLLDISFLIWLIYIPNVVQDIEMIFFCYLLASIFTRVCAVKALVAKVFSVNIEGRHDCENSKKIEVFTRRVNLDVSSVHKLYDLLHKCTEKLNCLMSLSMTMMIITTGLSMIMILKNTIFVIRNTNIYPYTEVTKPIVFFSVGRCLKYILLLIFPCYISNKTKGEVAIIRTMIHDALNSSQVDVIERRKRKAFFQLVCENNFAYTFFGVVHLDMSLPLSYFSLCITYLIIVVQFSKFFE